MYVCVCAGVCMHVCVQLLAAQNASRYNAVCLFTNLICITPTNN